MSSPSRTVRRAPTAARALASALVLAALMLVVAACTNGDNPTAENRPSSTVGRSPVTPRPNEELEPEPESEPEVGGGRATPDGEAGVTVEGDTPSPTPTPDQTALLSTIPGRLAIGAAAGLVVVEPDGAEVAVPADEPTVIAGQAVWSPDGERLAWSRLSPAGHELVVTTIPAEPDGEAGPDEDVAGEAVSPAPGPPAFYLQWAAAGDRLAYLRNDVTGPGVELGVAEPGRPVVPVATDGPLYVAWALDGLDLAAHLGALEVARFPLGDLALPGDEPDATEEADEAEGDEPEDGEEGEESGDPTGAVPEVVLEPSGLFTTPAWIDERTLVVVAPEGLALLDVDAGQTEILIEAEEEVLFVVSPDRRRIAYYLPELTDEGVSLVAHAQERSPTHAQTQTQTQAPEPGGRVAGLAVLDIDSGESVQVSPTVPLSFEWSPDGRTLAWLANDFDGTGGHTGWSFWDGTGITMAEPYRVSDRDRLTVLPFFEQYAISHSRWSPDGRAFAFAGILDDQPDGVASGIWIHVVGSGGPSIRIATGDAVTWGR